MNICTIKNNSMPINTRSILANCLRSDLFFDRINVAAAPAERPDDRNNGPSIDVFQRGRALKADNKMPVYIPSIIP